MLPRAPLTTDRRTGGAHRVTRELSAREELTLRLNEMAQEEELDKRAVRDAADFLIGDDDDYYYDHLLSKLETTHGRREL